MVLKSFSLGLAVHAGGGLLNGLSVQRDSSDTGTRLEDYRAASMSSGGRPYCFDAQYNIKKPAWISTVYQ
jgi:hypothetical protein